MEEPQFRTVLRGYDPDQVRAAFEEMQNALSTARRLAADRTIELTRMQEQHVQVEKDLDEAVHRIADLEARAAAGPTTSTADVGSRIGSILALANEEAEELRAAGRAEAQRQLSEASEVIAASRAELDRYAEGVRTNANAQAGQVVEEARRSAGDILAQAAQEAQARRAAAEALVESHRAKAAAVAEFGDQVAGHADRLRAASVRVEQLAQEEATLIERQSQESHERIQQETDHQRAAAAARRDSMRAQLSTVGALLSDLGAAVGVTPEGPAGNPSPDDAHAKSAGVGSAPAGSPPAGSALGGAAQIESVAGGQQAERAEVAEPSADRPAAGTRQQSATEDADHDARQQRPQIAEGPRPRAEVDDPSATQELVDWVGEGGAEDVDAVADRQGAGASR